MSFGRTLDAGLGGGMLLLVLSVGLALLCAAGVLLALAVLRRRSLKRYAP